MYKISHLIKINDRNIIKHIIYTFIIAFIFAPFSFGIQYYLLFIILYELGLYYYTKDIKLKDRFIIRVFINYISISAWIISRIIFCHYFKIL